MKKLFLTLIMFIPCLLANAQGPIKAWNDQLDDFIDVFNELDPVLNQLYSEKGVGSFAFTYYDPDTGNVVKEASVFDSNAYDNIDDNMMSQAKTIALNHLAEASRKNSRMNSIVNEFSKRGTEVVLMYSTNKNDNKVTKKIVITPAEIKSAK